MFGSDYVEVGIPEKRTIQHLGIVCSPTSDKEVGTGQMILFLKKTGVLKSHFPETQMLAKEASENTHA